MMKNIYFCIFIAFLSFGAFAQKHLPNDTCFYSNGSIKYIKVNLFKASNYVEPAILYYNESENILDRSHPIKDTLYSNGFAQRKDWTQLNGVTVINFYDGAYVLIEKENKTARSGDLCYSEMKGEYTYVFPKFDNLELTLVYTKDSLISVVRLFTIDTTKFNLPHKDVFVSNCYSKGLKFQDGDIGNMFDCGKLGTIELIFDNHNILSKFCFYPHNVAESATEYTFYPNFFCKSVAHTINKRLNGMWYEYHSNGNLKNFGQYAECTINNKIENVKIGKWQYFDDKGKLLLVETWDKGKLLK